MVVASSPAGTTATTGAATDANSAVNQVPVAIASTAAASTTSSSAEHDDSAANLSTQQDPGTRTSESKDLRKKRVALLEDSSSRESGAESTARGNDAGEQCLGEETASEPFHIEAEPGTEQAAGTATKIETREAPEVLRVIAELLPCGSTVQLGEKKPHGLMLGCDKCDTTAFIASPSNEIVYTCKRCNQPFHAIYECRACGNKLVLTQDEHYTTEVTGRHCPVCMELVKD